MARNKSGQFTTEPKKTKDYERGYARGKLDSTFEAIELGVQREAVHQAEISFYHKMQPFFVLLGGIVTIIVFGLCSFFHN